MSAGGTSTGRYQRTGWLCLLAYAALAGCHDDTVLTQIGVVIENDEDNPVEIDRVTVEVSGPSGMKPQSASANLDEQGLPRKLTLVHDEGPFGPLRVTVAGWLADTEVVQYKTLAWFKEKKTWHLQIELTALCQDQWRQCGSEQTCEAGACREIVEQMGPAGPLDMASDGALGGTQGGQDGSNQPPECVIERPLRGETLFEGNDVKLEGTCSDPESGLLVTGLTWKSSINGDLGSGVSVKVKAKLISLGVHELRLCATDPMGLEGCSEELSIPVVPKPPPPLGRIESVSQGSRDEGPFSSAEPIEFKAVASRQDLQFSWSDAFTGDFSGDANATLNSPPVGRHRVTMTIIDEAEQSVQDTVDFDVIDGARFDAGRTNLIESYDQVNEELQASGELGVVAIATDTTGLALVSNGQQVYAFQGNRPDATPVPAVTDPDESDITPLSDVTGMFILADQQGSLIYFAIDQGLLVCPYTPGMTPIVRSTCASYADRDGNPIPDARVTSLARLQVDDATWLGAGTSAGLVVISDTDGTTGEVVSVTNSEESIRAVVASAGSFWFATQYNGLYQYDPATENIPALFSAGAPAPPLTALAVDQLGGIWMGSEDHGLGHFESSTTGLWQGSWMSGRPFEGLASNRIQVVKPASGYSLGAVREVIWVGTDRGLTRFDFAARAFTTLAMEAGLPSDDVRAIGVLINGNIVIGTSEGVALYDGW